MLPTIKDDRLFAVYYLAFATGLRRGELLALQWRNVNLKEGVLHVRQTLIRVSDAEGNRKTKLIFSEPKTPQSRRTVPIPKECISALRRHRAWQAKEKLMIGQSYQDYDLVVCQLDGRPIDPRNFDYHFGLVLKRAGLPHIRLHDARHTFATLMLELGVSPKTVSELLGHSKISVTLDVYSHVSLELEKQAAAKLNDALTSGLM